MHIKDVPAEVCRAALRDPTLGESECRELADRVFRLCGQSPAALRRLIELRPVSERTAPWYLALLESVLHTWKADTAEATFLSWLERRTREKAVLELIEFRRMNARRPPMPELLLSDSQQKALEYLNGVADVYFEGGWRSHRIPPNCNVLIAAPSGSGKSYVVTSFAEALRLPMMRLSYAQWLPGGSRKQPDTLSRLKDFILAHERSILFVDEIDKASGVDQMPEWSAGVAAEVYGVLDRTAFDATPSLDTEVQKRISDRLKYGVLIVASGTWSSVWRDRRRTLGFGGGATMAPATLLAEARRIPDELLRRFGGEPVFLQAPSVRELQRLATEDGLDGAARRVGILPDYIAGADSNEAMRWLTSLRLQVELRRREGSRARSSIEAWPLSQSHGGVE